MTTIDSPALEPPAPAQWPRGTGPVSAARQRRTLFAYLALCATGLAPVLAGASVSWQAAGLGLIIPGGGFLALGGWWMLLTALTLLLFMVSVIAWFWAGAIVAPVTVWLGSALIAGVLANDPGWPHAPAAALVLAAGIGLGMVRHNAGVVRARLKQGATRAARLPQSLAAVDVMVRAEPDEAARELTPDQLAGLRYLLDRALQPVERFDGFNIIDQFQPAALRYQINHIGFALGIAQRTCLTAFRGYLGQAQRNMIEKYLRREVWDYWVLESCWGHLNFSDWNPAGRDNIMLTGWFGAHVGQYMLATGDRRYLEPGSLTFRLDDRRVWAHDYRTIVGSVDENYTRADFGHYACEPNWIYPICNHYAMLALVTHDAITGSDLVGRHLPNWLDKLDTEFTNEDGSVVGLRSQITGLPFPFPVAEYGYAHFENCFAPARARQLWAIARSEIEPQLMQDEQGPRLTMAGAGIDIGNYRAGHTGDYGNVLVAAREFGDARLADAALAGLEHECKPTRDGGVLRFLTGSNLSNATAIMGLMMQTGDFRRLFTHAPTAEALAGPMIDTDAYPAVLVARAWTDGVRLEAVFYPGSGDGRQLIAVSQLVPGKEYRLTGAEIARVVASAEGTASIPVHLAGRTAVTLTPD